MSISLNTIFLFAFIYFIYLETMNNISLRKISLSWINHRPLTISIVLEF